MSGVVVTDPPEWRTVAAAIRVLDAALRGDPHPNLRDLLVRTWLVPAGCRVSRGWIWVVRTCLSELWRRRYEDGAYSTVSVAASRQLAPLWTKGLLGERVEDPWDPPVPRQVYVYAVLAAVGVRAIAPLARLDGPATTPPTPRPPAAASS